MLPILLFLAVPMLGFIVAMKDLRRWESMLTFILTYTLYGFATSFELDTADSYRIARRFYFGIWNVDSIFVNYANGNYTDLYRYFVYAFVQQYTMNPKVLYAVFSFVYSIFVCLSLTQFYIVWKGKKTTYFYLLVFLAFVHLSFFNIQTTRYFTASAVFIYFTIQFLYFNRKLALIGICTTPFIHFSFFFAVAVVISYKYIVKTSRFSKYCYWFYVATVVLTLAKPQTWVDETMGDEEEQEEMTSNASINRKIKTYSKTSKNNGPKVSSGKKASAYSQGKSAFKKLTGFLYIWGLLLICTLFHKKQMRGELNQDETQAELLNFIFYFFGATTFVSLFFSNGGRFRHTCDAIMMFWICAVFVKNESVRWKDYVIMLYPIKLYQIAFFLFNAPRHCESLFWWATPISTIIQGINFDPPFIGSGFY